MNAMLTYISEVFENSHKFSEDLGIWDKVVMQCFLVGYHGICHASLVFSVYTRAFRRVCMRRKYNWQVACSTVSHEKALHYYFIPICLNLRKIYGNFRKLRKCFKPVFEELLKTIYEDFGKLIFGNLRILLENFGNSSKVFFRCS